MLQTPVPQAVGNMTTPILQVFTLGAPLLASQELVQAESHSREACWGEILASGLGKGWEERVLRDNYSWEVVNKCLFSNQKQTKVRIPPKSNSVKQLAYWLFTGTTHGSLKSGYAAEGPQHMAANTSNLNCAEQGKP